MHISGIHENHEQLHVLRKFKWCLTGGVHLEALSQKISQSSQEPILNNLINAIRRPPIYHFCKLLHPFTMRPVLLLLLLPRLTSIMLVWCMQSMVSAKLFVLRISMDKGE